MKPFFVRYSFYHLRVRQRVSEPLSTICSGLNVVTIMIQHVGYNPVPCLFIKPRLFLVFRCRNFRFYILGHPLFEVTSSGLTHSCSASLLPSGICDWTLKYAHFSLGWNSWDTKIKLKVVWNWKAKPQNPLLKSLQVLSKISSSSIVISIHH